ncbi:hypothetical protein [Blastococcus sp. TF02-8]|uniref:hypothetical protein n=1 Tax=Blastococcus sp. TF02-8 TaxID=2250574 RepID=UPI0011BDAF50|nr:hypothetical protein [Blastococcus sp. TF02-8]
MLVCRSVALGLLTVLLGLSACSAEETTPPQQPAVAVADYAAPAGAPAVCGGIARSTHFLDIPAAMGELAAGADAIDARSRLAAARGELRALVSGLSAADHPELQEAADDLLAALLGVLEPPLTEGARTAVLDSVEQFVTRLQPVCGFPA